MSYINAINRALDYIEENLKGDLKVDIIAEHVGISKYHFHRVFSKNTGEKLADYIIRRRLTHSSFDLLDSNRPIIDIALDYGYNSQAAFTRSFKKIFNKSPNRYRKDSAEGIPSVITKLDIDYLKPEMLYNIKNIGELTLAGYELESTTIDGQDSICSCYLFNILQMEYRKLRFPIIRDRVYLIKEFKNGQNQGPVKIFVGIDCVEDKDIPEGMILKKIPDNSYAVFNHRGPVDTVKKYTHKAIYNDLLPKIDVKIDKSYVINIFEEDMSYIILHSDISKSVKREDWYMYKNSFTFDIYLPIKE